MDQTKKLFGLNPLSGKESFRLATTDSEEHPILNVLIP